MRVEKIANWIQWLLQKKLAGYRGEKVWPTVIFRGIPASQKATRGQTGRSKSLFSRVMVFLSRLLLGRAWWSKDVICSLGPKVTWATML